LKKKVIIIGGGTAGMVIANNLQEKFDVVVIEKSDHQKYPLKFKIPLLIGLLFRNRKTSYIYNRNLTLLDGRQIPFFESNVLGGASVINGCVHMVGNKLHWTRILKKFDSNYDDLLHSFHRLYSKDKYQKYKINLRSPLQGLIDKSFVKTLNNLEIPKGDTNFSNEENCGPLYDTVSTYFRDSVLSLIRKRLFNVFMGEKVNKIVFNDDGSVAGVETDQRTFDADYVILSAGVIGTCDFLLRSKEQYSQLKDVPVGNGLQDHTNLRVNVFTNKKINSINEISLSFFKKLMLLVKHFAGQPTVLLGTGATSAAHLDLDKDGIVDTRIQIVQFTETGRHGSEGKFFDEVPGFSISITAINPESKGEISLDASTNVVNQNFLSASKDVELLKLALEFCLKLLRSRPLSDHVSKILEEESIEKDPVTYIVNNIFSGHHLNGGAQDSINADFEVKNTKDLYVCDASVFDGYAASNIHSSVVLIADIFSKKFIEKNAIS